MKLVIFDKKEIEHIKRSDIIKYGILTFATPIGLILSCVLAYLNVDFKELLKIFIENISNPEVLDKSAWILRKWHRISFTICGVASLLLVIYFVCNRKKDEEDALTWGQTLFLTGVLIMISQVVLPLSTVIVVIVIALLYLVFFSFMLLKIIIGYGTYL